MRQRGRKSATSLQIPVIDAARIPLAPPAHLAAAERQRFVDLVASCDPGHFCEADVSLLCRYIEHDLQAERAARELRTHGAVLSNGRPSGWLVVQEKAVRALTALAMRLRIGPQSRIDRKSTALRGNAAPQSFYERMRLNDDDIGNT